MSTPSDQEQRQRGRASTGREHRRGVPELGRIVENRPRAAVLEVYIRRDERRGAKVTSLETGRQYGVMPGVLAAFAEVGRYTGWAYINAAQTTVFLFREGSDEAPPDSLLAIRAGNEHVAVPPGTSGREALTHRAWVGFHACVGGQTRGGRPKRRATYVFVLNADHPRRIAELIAAGRIAFPDHDEVVELFFEGLKTIEHRTADQDSDLIDAALAFLASDAGVPSQIQMLARVERSRAGVSRPVRTSGRGQGTKRAGPTEKRSSSRSEEAADAKVRQAAIGDVERVNLRFD